METTSHAPGTFCWVDLSTTDAPAAKTLYNKLFGWDYVDNPMGEGMVYTMCQIGGKNVGALYSTNDPKNPPHWELYVSVLHVDEYVEKAKSLGGSVIMGPYDVADHGRMALLADPSGAMFSVWQAKTHIGYEESGVPGTQCWAELLTNDTAACKAFYGGLFGWEADESMGYYTMFKSPGAPMGVGGMMGMTPEMAPMPPNWTPYFFVNNADEAVEIAKVNGAKLLHGPEDVPGMVRYAIIMDGAGGVFGVFHPLGQPESGAA